VKKKLFAVNALLQKSKKEVHALEKLCQKEEKEQLLARLKQPFNITIPPFVLAQEENTSLVAEKVLRTDMEVENYIDREEMGEEVALFEEDFIEEAREEAKEKRRLQRENEAKERIKRYTKKYKKTKKNKKKKKKKKKKHYVHKKKKKKNRFAIKDFKKWFKYSLGYKTTFANLENDSTNRSYVKASLTISPIKYFFIGATFKKDVNSYHNKYYQPDFSYSFGYSDWHQGTINFGYSNYANNKFNPKGKERRFNFKSGAWDLGYKDTFFNIKFGMGIKYIPKRKKGSFSLRASKMFKNGLFFSSTLKTYLYMNQQRLSLTAKKYLYKNLFVKGSLYLYSHYDKQTFLEPDYAYTVGWKAKKKGDISISYSNYYTPTRWNWREKEGPAFNTGSLSVSMSF